MSIYFFILIIVITFHYDELPKETWHFSKHYATFHFQYPAEITLCKFVVGYTFFILIKLLYKDPIGNTLFKKAFMGYLEVIHNFEFWA